ncbi:MAG TPA: patatin-like phospholipase family protein [Vicinamibacterales bacterium]|jgi:hypothetical protein
MTPTRLFERQYPQGLRDRENELLNHRRDTAGVSRDKTVVGLALSGGGIRSATFVLGFCQGLAQLVNGDPGLLRRVDIVSTVSGGGYFGAFLGALFTRQTKTGEVESRLNNTFSRPINWLRENGRYLAPNGSGDSLLAGAIVLRNWAAVTVVMSTAMLAAMTAAHVVRGLVRDLLESRMGSDGAARLLAGVGSATAPSFAIYWSAYLFPALVMFVFIAFPLGWAYWMGRWSKNLDHMWVWTTTLSVVLGAAAAAFVFRDATYGTAMLLLTVVGAETLAAGAVVSLKSPKSDDDPSGDRNFRNVLSRAMTAALVLSAVIAIFAVVDTLGQTTYVLAWGGAFQQKTLGAVAAGIFSLVAGSQGMLKFLDRGKSKNRRVKLPVAIVAALVAIVVSLVLLTALSAVSHGLARRWAEPMQEPTCPQSIELTLSLESFIKVTQNAACRAPILPRIDWLAAIAATIVLLIVSLLFGRSLPFVNLSSLSQFYSARLSRTYVGASNPARLTGAGINLTEEVPGDDMAMDRYAPQDKGGPLHLINVTLNETVGGSSQIEDRDRKGLAMSVGPAGVSVGVTQHAAWKQQDGVSQLVEIETSPTAVSELERSFRVWKGNPIVPRKLSLSQWTAISGAAVAPGMGAQTSIGVSILLALSNVRLGYWWQSGVDPSKQGGTRPKPSVRIQRGIARMFPVQSALLRELVGLFQGAHERLWFLSDGGHFENTACYELLRRRVPIIIVCDDGADPDYEFEDLGNLVRKARLDFGAEVRVLEPLNDKFGVPADFRRKAARQGGPGLARHHVMAAQVLYPDGGHASTGDMRDGRAQSLLIIVKPALTGDEPWDVLQYAAAHPAFPQEPTSDQFFDEAQWESYRKLGEHVGSQVNLLDVDKLFSELPAPEG